MAYYVSAELAKKAGKTNQAWFNISNGWTTDAFGVVSFKATSAQDQGGDSELLINGVCVSGSHAGYDWGHGHSCVCPKGVKITVTTNRGTVHLKYRRMHD
ncbi:hypothetical protein CCF60_003148 [Salmonella enterica subsp. enterica serovar Berkeley]|nr:hypothetical protein [Salmonella enterica subsp. enterica serovar Berkeley]